MNNIQLGILTLIKSAITNESYPLPEDFNMEEAYPLIKKHHLIPIAYAGALQCGIDQNLPVMQSLFKTYYKFLIRMTTQIKEFDRISNAFDQNHIDYLPLKGCRLHKLYPKPEYRCMGDLDILIRPEQYEQIIPIMTSLGYNFRYESDHELVWYIKTYMVELHKRLIPSYNKDYYNYYGDGFSLAKPADGTKYELSLNDEFIYLFTHFSKHYRDGGIGCKHIIDLWIYRRTFPDLDENYICNQLKELQLYEFYQNILALIQVWFEHGKSNEKTDFISDYIFASGSWGQFKNRKQAAIYKESKTHGTIKTTKRKRLIKRIFPAMKWMQTAYPSLKKAPVLLPFYWVKRWFDVVFFRRQNIKRAYNIHKITSIENVQSFQDSLNYVGLDFNFK